MTTSVTALAVSIGEVRVGLLHRSGEGSYFELDDDYLAFVDRPTLGQVFEDKPRQPYRTRQGVPSWFANLLPEGPLRGLIAERAGVSERRSLFLLKLLGDDLPGAVTVRPANGDVVDETPLTPSMDDEAPLRFSLAGVQMKFSAVRKSRGLTIPAQGVGGDWIVKLPDQRFAGVPENEYLMMQFAHLAGITVPDTQLVNVDAIAGLPESVLLAGSTALAIQRFDRAAGGKRIHIEDFAQVLDLAPREKYKGTNYDSMIRVTSAVCPQEDVDEFLRRLVFAIAIGNSDAHAKNWSLIYPDGRSARIAPAYDLVAVSQYEAIEKRLSPLLALHLARTRSPNKVTEATFRQLAKRAHLDEERTIEVVREALSATRTGWEAVKRSQGSMLSPELRDLLDSRLDRLPLFAQAQ